MRTLRNAGYRLLQQATRLAMYLLPWREPKLTQGENAVGRAAETVREAGLQRPLIVTDRGIVKAGLAKRVTAPLDQAGISYAIFDETVPNPTIANIEAGLLAYHAAGCDGLIAIGGGSAMDCAKGIGARVARPRARIPQFRGNLKILKKLPPFIAIPTTAGSGSEATLAAVITDEKTHEKYPVNDVVLIPGFAILDPTLTLGLPPRITAETGMDALTHAVEAYIGQANTRKTRAYSEEALGLIYRHLLPAYQNGADLPARMGMQQAAHLAGKAFTRAYVGYAHAMAHALGARYDLAHGLANAVILPRLLSFYGEAVWAPLARMARLIDLPAEADTDEALFRAFIAWVDEMNRRMGIPDRLDRIQTADIPALCAPALREANPGYPVPRILSREDLIQLFIIVKEGKRYG